MKGLKLHENTQVYFFYVFIIIMAFPAVIAIFGDSLSEPILESLTSIGRVLDLYSVIAAAAVASIAWVALRQNGQVTAKPVLLGFTAIVVVNLFGQQMLGNAMGTPGSLWLMIRSIELLTMVFVLHQLRLMMTSVLWLILGVAVVGFFATMWVNDPRTALDASASLYPVGFAVAISFAKLVLAGLFFSKSLHGKIPPLMVLSAAFFVMGIGELLFVLNAHRSELFAVLASFYTTVAYTLVWLTSFNRLVKAPYELDRTRLELVRKENSELKMALDAHAIVAITDARGVITEVNDKFCAISQYAREELVGQTHKLINSGHHPREFFRNLWYTISRGEVWSGDVCNRAKDGSLYWVQSTIVPFLGKNGRPEQYVAIRADITAKKEAEAVTRRMALHDELTGLPNRRLATDRLAQAISDKARRPGFGAVLLIDLDNFKEVNDTLGHAVGDTLIQQAGERLTNSVRQVDTVARIGGDEFVIVLDTVGSDLESAVTNSGRVGEQVRSALNEPYRLGSQDWDVTPSIGIALFSSADDSPDELTKRADIALYEAKDNGRNQVCFFNSSLQEEAIHRTLLTRDLRQALDNHELSLNYQPLISERMEVLGFEALIRWNHPKHGLISPDTFIPLAEQSGLILPIGEWVLKTACAQQVKWAKNPKYEACTVAVNVSARQLKQADFVDTIKRAISLTGIRADRLRLELTESMLQDNVDSTIAKMRDLRELGVRFSLDDFGTGYSSLNYLKRLPLDILKIDRSFIRDIFEDSTDAAIVRTIIALSASLDLRVVAEGVETKEQMEWLLEHDCELFQGYLFTTPVPKDQIESVLRKFSA